MGTSAATDILKVLTAVLFVLGALAVVVLAIVRFVQFWIAFAQGMNEATEKHVRGFTVEKPEPVLPVPPLTGDAAGKDGRL